MLAHAPFDADLATLSALSSSLARLLGATAIETVAAAEAAARALMHPLLREAAASPDARREVAVTAERDDGTLAEGVIDLAYRSANGWVVVDFKTDAVVPTIGAYAEQLRLYVEALQRATGEPARGVLLQV